MKLISTTTKNLFYTIRATDTKKVYYARFRKNGKEVRRKLSTSLKESKTLLKQLLKLDVIQSAQKTKNSIESILPSKEGNTKYSLNQVFKEYIELVSPNQSQQRPKISGRRQLRYQS